MIFLMREEVERNWAELEGGEAIIRIYYMRKEFIFSKRKNMSRLGRGAKRYEPFTAML